MHKVKRETRTKIAFTTLILCIVLGSLIGYFGLQSYNELLTVFSASTLIIGILVFVICLIYPFKWDGFWFSYMLQRLGQIGWLRKFELSPYAEGAITLILLANLCGNYIQIIVGGGSYVLNDLSTLAFRIFTDSWLLVAIHLHYTSLEKLSDLSKIVDSDQRASFNERIKRINSWFNKTSTAALIIGMAFFIIVTTYWIDTQENTSSRLTFYVQTPSNRPTFAMVYPPTVIPYYVWKFTVGLTYGFLALIGELIFITVVLLLWLTSGKIKLRIDIYAPNCIKSAEKMLNTLWLLTGAGLLLVPYMTALSLNLQAAGYPVTARWSNYVSWTYIIIFVGIFSFSLIRFYAFVSAAKKPVEEEIKAELKDALEPRVDRKKLAAARIKLRLLQEFKSRPTLTTLLQLLQIISVILLNLLINLLK